MALTLNLSWIDGQVSESRKLIFAYSHIPRTVAKQQLDNRKSLSFSYFFPLLSSYTRAIPSHTEAEADKVQGKGQRQVSTDSRG